jgi:DNA invertase Pin-like site-specific DNA recombinase
MKALIYTRVSTNEQGRSGISLEHQAQACEALAAREGLEVVEVLTEVKSGGSLRKRPVLTEALDRLAKGEAQVLVVAKLDRLSRSLLDFATMLHRSEAQGWSLIVGDLGLSTTTPVGRLQASIVAAVAEFERERIRQRARETHEVQRSQGRRMGGKAVTSREVVEYAARLRSLGQTYAAIANALNEAGHKPARGGQMFHPASVRALLLSEQGRAVAAA